VNKAETAPGTVLGNLFVDIVADDGSGPPGLPDQSTVESSSAPISIDDLVVGDSVLEIDMPDVPLEAGDYQIVVSTNQAYKDSYVITTNRVAVRIDSTSPTVDRLAVNNGSVWSAVAGQAMAYKVEGRPLDFRIRVTSSAPMVMTAFGAFYDHQPINQVTATRGVQRERFQGLTPPDDFLITEFLPLADHLEIWDPDTGDSWKVGGTQGWEINGRTLIPPPTFIYDDRNYEFIFIQNKIAGVIDDSPFNSAIIGDNYLGSTDPSIDRSRAGKGIKLRAEDGILYEIVPKAGGAGIDIFEVTP